VQQKGKKVIASPMRFRDNKTCAEVVHQAESPVRSPKRDSIELCVH